ncbi:flavin reductase family protein [Streptomyces sp. NPDC057638]|uniref:flavin reductase family protein n=1 Tax=Streptomyces sp. NPDC057638 TaxID=3346190 RepID=UPI0036922832
MSILTPDTGTGVDQGTFRGVMGRFPSFVTVITTPTPHGPAGCTATAVLSLSLEPPSVVVSLRTEGHTLHAIRTSGHFAVNALSWRQRVLVTRFASGDPGRRFDGVPYAYEDGVPVLDGCSAAVVCRLTETVEVFDHTLLIGTVLRARGDSATPLVLLDGTPHRIDAPARPLHRADAPARPLHQSDTPARPLHRTDAPARPPHRTEETPS